MATNNVALRARAMKRIRMSETAEMVTRRAKGHGGHKRAWGGAEALVLSCKQTATALATATGSGEIATSRGGAATVTERGGRREGAPATVCKATRGGRVVEVLPI
jgi:hypothetical protein